MDVDDIAENIMDAAKRNTDVAEYSVVILDELDKVLYKNAFTKYPHMDPLKLRNQTAQAPGRGAGWLLRSDQAHPDLVQGVSFPKLPAQSEASHRGTVPPALS